MRRRKKKSRAIVSCKKGFVCLSLIIAVQLMPQTVLADDSAGPVNPADSTAQADPADAAAQDSPADSAEVSEGLPEVHKEESVEEVPTEEPGFSDDENTQDNGTEASGNDADADVIAAVPDDAESGEGEDVQDSVREAPGNDANINAASPDVLGETVDTTMTSSTSCDKAGKTTWTALFENGIFTKQTRSVDTEPTCEETEEETADRKSKSDDSGVRTNTVKTASAAAHQTSAHTADDADPPYWSMLFAAALAGMTSLLTLYRSRHSTNGSLTDRPDSGCRN